MVRLGRSGRDSNSRTETIKYSVYVYSASIKTVTDYLSPIGDPREFLYNRAMIDLNIGMEFTQLDKWLYFYHTEIREPVTAWHLSNGIIHIDPGPLLIKVHLCFMATFTLNLIMKTLPPIEKL